MTNKKNLGIGGIIVLLIAAYLGLDLSGHKTTRHHHQAYLRISVLKRRFQMME